MWSMKRAPSRGSSDLSLPIRRLSPPARITPSDPGNLPRHPPCRQALGMAVDVETLSPQIARQGDAGLLGHAHGEVGGRGAGGEKDDAEPGGLGHHLGGDPPRADEHRALKVDAPEEGLAGEPVEGVVAAEVLRVEQKALRRAHGGRILVADVDPVGEVPPGSQKIVEVTVEIEDIGQKRVLPVQFPETLSAHLAEHPEYPSSAGAVG